MDYLTLNDGRLPSESSSQYNKRRSKSICAPQNISMDKLASVSESFARERSQSSRSPGSSSASLQSGSGKSSGVRKKSTSNLQITYEECDNSRGGITDNGAISSQRRKSAQGLIRPQGKNPNPPSPTSTFPYSAGRRKSNAFLEVPTSNYMHGHGEEEEETVTLRTFSSSKQGVINRGDSFIRRRSRSASLIPPVSPLSSPIKIPENLLPIPSADDSYVVGMLGGTGVGKASLNLQFRTSECINAYDNGESLNEKNISIVLDGIESELNFVFDSRGEKDLIKTCDAFLVIYSVVDKASFNKAEEFLNILQDMDLLRSSACILVGNKVDLVRSRMVSTQDGKFLACTYRTKFIEISVGININVDDLLAGILKQIRLKKERYELYGDRDTDHWYKNRAIVRASMKARQWITWIFGIEDSKFKNCENLQIL